MWNGGCGFIGRGMFGSGMFGGGWFMMIIPILLIGFVFYFFTKTASNNNRMSSLESNSALAILDERFANGEIDEEEYSRKKKALRR